MSDEPHTDQPQDTVVPAPAYHPPLRWWVEVLLVAGFYGVYSLIRNQFGSALGASIVRQSYANAISVIDFESALGLYIEPELQERFLGWDWFLIGWNVFYGTFHFVITIGTMVYLFVKAPLRYSFMRSTLCLTTGTALIGFALFPLMPPRLLGNCESAFGACNPNHTFVDTLTELGGLWSFETERIANISNQYAAMPSLHIAWAVWCAVALSPLLRRRITRIVVWCYPILTLFAIMVTANHYWLDAFGGLIALGVGLLLAPFLTRLLPGPTGTLSSDVVERPLRT